MIFYSFKGSQFSWLVSCFFCFFLFYFLALFCFCIEMRRYLGHPHIWLNMNCDKRSKNGTMTRNKVLGVHDGHGERMVK